MNRIYLVHPPHFKDDIFKIGGSEQFENDRLKSYGKGTEILAMVVVNGNYREVEKEIKKSFNAKFTLFHGKEHFQGNRDEMKLEFLKIVYNYELRKSCFNEKETCQYCNKKFVSKYTLKKHFETSKCNNRLIRTPKIVESFITDIELDSILFRFIDEKINLISREEYKLTPTLEKQKKRTKPSVLFDWFINYINKLLLKTRITKNGFYELLEKHNLELITEEENSYYLCNHIANQKKVNNDNDSKIDETLSEEEDNKYKLKVD